MLQLTYLCHNLMIYVNAQTELQSEDLPGSDVRNYGRSMKLITDLWLKRAGYRKSCTLQRWSVGWKWVLKMWELANSFQSQDLFWKFLYNQRVLIQGVINSKLPLLTWPNHYNFKNKILRYLLKKELVNHEIDLLITFLSIF